jgi:hypothetical protein
MKKVFFLFSISVMIISNLSALPPIGKKDKKDDGQKEEPIVEQNNDASKSKITVEPYKSIGITSLDNLGYDSYRLARATDSLQKEANFLQITQVEKQDPALGTVTDIVCKDGSGNIISCQGLNKEESLKKFESILSSLGEITKSVAPLVATIPQIQSEITSLQSNPMKAAKAVKGSASLIDIGKSLSSTGQNSASLISNINTSIKNLKMIKGQ